MAGVLSLEAPGGLAETETTMAQVMKSVGYGTTCIGKWHLGRPPAFLPTSRDCDSYYGIPSSHDMDPSVLMRDKETMASPVAIRSLTQRYTEQAVRFIERSKDSPFFLYLPYSAPHLPLAAL